MAMYYWQELGSNSKLRFAYANIFRVTSVQLFSPCFQVWLIQRSFVYGILVNVRIYFQKDIQIPFIKFSKRTLPKQCLIKFLRPQYLLKATINNFQFISDLQTNLTLINCNIQNKIVQMASPFKSIEDSIILPSMHKVAKHSKIFRSVMEEETDTYKLDEPLLLKTNELVQELNNSFQIYDNSSEYKFEFPKSLFPPVAPGQINNIRYEQKQINEQENTFKDRLSEEQLRDIEENGQFKVRSNIQYITLPYVWRINPSLFWGTKKVSQVWYKSIATIFGFFWTAKQFMEYQIPLQLKQLGEYPKKFVDLLFGLKSIKTVVSVDYEKEIFKDFWKKILNENYTQSDQWCSALWQYLYVYNNPQMYRPIEPSNDRTTALERERQKEEINDKFQAAVKASEIKRNEIIDIYNKFNVEWGKLRKKVIIDITAEVNETKNESKPLGQSQQQKLLQAQTQNSNDEKILQKLSQRKFTLYVEHMKAQLPKKSVDVSVVNAIVFLLRLFNLINLKVQKKQKQKSKKLEQVRQKIRNLYKIKSLFVRFFNHMVDLEIKPINKSLDEEVYEDILKDASITKMLRGDQIEAIKEYLKLKVSHDALIQAKKKSLPQYHGPTRVFYSNYHLLPPYQVLQDQNTKYYSLKKISDDLTIDTSTNFWKLKLYWMRFKTWTINCLVFLAFSAWKGPLGLRCLWGVADFNYQMNVQYDSGEIYYYTRSTVLGTFNKVLDGIEKSRRAFEQTPDLGLLGKNISRYGNYFECYIFRFLFVGVILTLIGYPFLIVFASTLIILLVVTFWAWIPLIMVVCYIFNILIKQFETSCIEYGFWSRSFPLITQIFGILKCILVILFSISNLIVISPILTLFLIIYSSLQRLFRTTLDSIFVFAFRRLGRTPSRDTNIAKKISGPGMTKDFYMSINEQDVYVLVQARLERVYLEQFNRIIREKLQYNANKFRAIMDKVLRPFNVSYNGDNAVIANTNDINNNYQKQYIQFCNRYPAKPYKVRFTQGEIDNYFDNTINIVRRFVDKHQISGWIFEKYQLYEGMYDELTRAVWMDIFACGEEIFQPLEKLDSRFKLEDQYSDSQEINYQMKRKVNSVMKALEGQVQLKHTHKKLIPFKHNLLSREKSFEQIHAIFHFWALNSIENVQTHLNDLRIVFVPNLNIKDIIVIDDEARIRRIKEEKFIIDL